MSSTLLDEYRRKYGLLLKTTTVTGAQANQSVLPLTQKHLMDDTEVTDEDAEWIVVEAVIEMTGAGTFVFTDGTTAKHSPLTLIANQPFYFHGPINIGIGKVLAITTTGAFNTKLDVWASQRCYRLSKPAKTIGT